MPAVPSLYGASLFLAFLLLLAYLLSQASLLLLLTLLCCCPIFLLLMTFLMLLASLDAVNPDVANVLATVAIPAIASVAAVPGALAVAASTSLSLLSAVVLKQRTFTVKTPDVECRTYNRMTQDQTVH